MRPSLLTVSLLFTFSLFFFHPLPPVLSEQAGGGEVLTDPDAIRAFADSLFYRGLLFRAAMEYQRFVYLYPSHPDTPGVLFNLATAAKLAGAACSDRPPAINCRNRKNLSSGLLTTCLRGPLLPGGY